MTRDQVKRPTRLPMSPARLRLAACLAVGVALLAGTAFGVVATGNVSASGAAGPDDAPGPIVAVDDTGEAALGPIVAADDTGEPALAFTSREFSFLPTAFLFCDHGISDCNRGDLEGSDWDDHNDDLVLGNRYFGRVGVRARDDDADGVKFAVEGVSGDTLQWCNNIDSDPPCHDMLLEVREESGLLYLFLDDRDNDRPYHYVNGLPVRAAELSAEDSESDLKVYREVVVGPSERAPGCDDYPSANRDRFTCLYMGELLPPERPETSSSLRDSLPSLVQSKENYSLVFAEEFNGTPTENGCKEGLDNGMATLDSDLWNYDPNPCDSRDTDSLGEPCQNIRDGRYYMTKVYSCRGVLTTYGKFSFKYGYIEVKFTVNTAYNDFYQNYAFSAGNPTVGLEFLHDDYNIVVDSYEDIARVASMETNIFEHLPSFSSTVSHTYINGGGNLYDAPLVPTSSGKRNRYCGGNGMWQIIIRHAGCSNNGKITVTLGLEWTPGGYRSFQKIDGHDDSLAVRPKDKIGISHKPVSVSNSGYTFSSSKQSLHGSARDKYFTYLDPDDTDSLLELVAISHRPMELIARASGWAESSHDTIRTRLEMDYIRIFQPADLYTNMEPVYQ